VAEEHLLEDEASLDGLAEPDVVGDEQVDPRHPERPHDGVELVVLDRDAALEGGVEVLGVGGGDGAPPDCVQECVKAGRVVEARARIRESGFVVDERPGLDLPDDGELFAEPVVLDGLQADEVLDLTVGDLCESVDGKRAPLDAIHDVSTLTDGDQVAGCGCRPCHPCSSLDKKSPVSRRGGVASTACYTPRKSE